jgi:predicted RNA-binding protein (virulence factor B family)
MLQLGQLNTLTALRRTDNGIYLVDDLSNEVLLPNKYIAKDVELGSIVEVFLYKDSEDRIVATNLTPFLFLNEYATLEAKVVNKLGAFFDWGLEKELLVPYSQQAKPIEQGLSYVVYLYLDELTDRLVGTTKISGTLEKRAVNLKPGDKVDLLPYDEGEIGISVIVDGRYQGMLYKNEIFDAVTPGVRLKGYVKKVREDHKVDVCLQPFGYRNVEQNVEKLIEALIANEGSLPLNDKSSPEDIVNQLGMSKKVFKKSVGALYKQQRLKISDTGISLIDNNFRSRQH